jgi:hypothetical protein
VAKLKGHKMLEHKQSVICGTIKNMDINDIKDLIHNRIIGELRAYDDSAKDDLNCSDIGFYLKHHMFHPKFININAKNIEFGETFHLTDFVNLQDDMDILHAFGMADILFELTIYRLGQYSYFTCDLTFLLPDPKVSEVQ